MAEAATPTRQELELTRTSLEGNVDRLVGRVRAELDWKARLSRDWPQLVAIGGGVVVVALTAVLLRRRFRPRKDGFVVDDFGRMTYGDLVKELKAMRLEIEKSREGGGGAAVKLATAAVTAAAGVAGRVAAGRLVDQSTEEPGKRP